MKERYQALIAPLLELDPGFQEYFDFAYDAHSDRKRIGTNDLYIIPPINVALNVLETGLSHDDKVMAIRVAVMHDVVEDEDVELVTVINKFGTEFAYHLYYTYTEITKSSGNRKFRKILEANHYAAGTRVSQTVKVCDAADNIMTIHLKSGRKFAYDYMNEKVTLHHKLALADPMALKLFVKRMSIVKQALKAA